jgi:uncharacterized protein (DUF4415 family)
MSKVKNELKTDWAALHAMTDEEIERNALEDPDALTPTDAMWQNARVVMPDMAAKRLITIRVSYKVLDYFKAMGRGYQSRMNAVLESYVSMDMGEGKESSPSPRVSR